MTRHRNGGLKKRCGCSRRTWAKCPHPWHFGYYHKGREYRYSLNRTARALGEVVPTTKTEAKELADRLRALIRAGNNPVLVSQEPDPMDRMTLRDVMLAYEHKHVDVPGRRTNSRKLMRWHLDMIRAVTVPAANGRWVQLADKGIDAITKVDIEAVRDARRTELRDAAKRAHDGRTTSGDVPGVKGGEVGINRLLARLRHVFSWGIEQGYVNETPFKRGGQTVIKLATRVETPRQRRLVDDEEQRLLAHAGWHLRGLIIAALGTGCRIGELLTLQWRQVRCDPVGQPILIDLAAEHTKTNEHRSIPVGQRLRALLELRRMDPQGVPLSSEACVFGTETGERVRSVKTAWRATCRRAGIADLHFHDLRREFACRLLESSANLHDVRDFLGHANITTTSRYLRSAPVRLVEALQRMEASATEPGHADERRQRAAVR